MNEIIYKKAMHEPGASCVAWAASDAAFLFPLMVVGQEQFSKRCYDDRSSQRRTQTPERFACGVRFRRAAALP